MIQLSQKEKDEIKKAKLEWRDHMRASFKGWTRKIGLRVKKLGY